MEKVIKAVLFDFDGVVVDTEGQYAEFWSAVGRKYLPGRKDFAMEVKGRSLKDIFEKDFPDVVTQETIRHGLDEAEKEMRYDYIPGVRGFVRALRTKGIRTAVVTSSDNVKMSFVYKACPEMSDMFDRVFTANDYNESKPSPDCFITAARYFGFSAGQCVVAEDSVNGLKAAEASGAFVLGLATTNPAEVVEKYADMVIPNFAGLTPEKLQRAFENAACLNVE